MWVTVIWLGKIEGPLAVALGFITTACIGFLVTHSLRIDSMLSIEIVERALNLPHSNANYSLSFIITFISYIYYSYLISNHLQNKS